MSALTVITQPAVEPVTLAEAKLHCRIDVADDDALIGGYILAARTHCEDFTNRAFINRTLQLLIDYDWPRDSKYRNRIVLPQPPVQSVSSINYIDSNGVSQLLAVNQYQISKGDIAGLIVPAYGVSWPAVRCQFDAITVQFVAGYGAAGLAVPEPIRQAILLLTAHLYEHRGDSGGEESELPAVVRSLLAKYVTEGWV